MNAKMYAYNSGLKSRFNEVIFEDFDEKELAATSCGIRNHFGSYNSFIRWGQNSFVSVTFSLPKDLDAYAFPARLERGGSTPHRCRRAQDLAQCQVLVFL